MYKVLGVIFVFIITTDLRIHAFPQGELNPNDHGRYNLNQSTKSPVEPRDGEVPEHDLGVEPVNAMVQNADGEMFPNGHGRYMLGEEDYAKIPNDHGRYSLDGKDLGDIPEGFSSDPSIPVDKIPTPDSDGNEDGIDMITNNNGEVFPNGHGRHPVKSKEVAKIF